MTPKPTPLVRGRGHLAEPAAAATWSRTACCIAWWRRAGCPASTGPPDGPGGCPTKSSVSSTISCGAAARFGVDQGDAEVVLALALHGQRAADGEIDDGRRGLPGVDLAVDQQAGLGDGDPRRGEGDRDRDVRSFGTTPPADPGSGEGARREPRVTLVTAFLRRQ